MLTSHFFAAPDFLELLQFWEASRRGRQLPDWSGDLGVIPRGILPNLIISDRRGEPTYVYVGAECIRRFGSDPTGKRAYADVLQGAHARYLAALSAETIARRAPIFSTAVYQPNASSMLMTGRLHTPFTYQGSRDVGALITVQLFSGSDQQLRETGLTSIVHEIRRDLIAEIPLLCDQLEAARRHYQISRHTRQRTLAQDIDAIVQALTGSALLPLPCLEDPEPVG